MDTILYDLNQVGKPFKLLNCTNGGPWYKRHVVDQLRTNFPEYKNARIPYSRNHDSAVHGTYGGPYSHDISNIFPNFDADPYDPASYDFACTDEDIFVCLEANTKTFFRLGQTIEHQIIKHNIHAPKDFHKWAVICEHIIRHYTEGWANGHHLDMEYWEIWNEPDLDPDEATNRRTWGGTAAQFFDLYAIAAKHLKTCFPHLKIGGPALAYNHDWAEKFLSEMQKREVPIDFFSWHMYATEPHVLTDLAIFFRELLDKYGYNNTESILNEWNYVRGWVEDFVYSLEAIHGMKGASFLSACISKAQDSPVDMLMYYDTRPSVFNGCFDFYNCKPLKGYYPMYWYGMFYDCQNEVNASNTIDHVYGICGLNKGKVLATYTYYSEDDTLPNKEFTIDFGRNGTYEIYLLDNDNNGTLWKTTSDLHFDLPLFSTILIKEI